MYLSADWTGAQALFSYHFCSGLCSFLFCLTLALRCVRSRGSPFSPSPPLFCAYFPCGSEFVCSPPWLLMCMSAAPLAFVKSPAGAMDFGGSWTVCKENALHDFCLSSFQLFCLEDLDHCSPGAIGQSSRCRDVPNSFDPLCMPSSPHSQDTLRHGTPTVCFYLARPCGEGIGASYDDRDWSSYTSVSGCGLDAQGKELLSDHERRSCLASQRAYIQAGVYQLSVQFFLISSLN